jgi:hypothetical protein
VASHWAEGLCNLRLLLTEISGDDVSDHSSTPPRLADALALGCDCQYVTLRERLNEQPLKVA